ncbi:MAG: uncharacterized protein KVP18_002394 [Porospora cf. gigantea A]|uniref:uncharacterized protein n=1 Tax=Porospora cf. gigantea A TaxID=2853593 RepID=UPI003559CA12|nr:MAG: hypothetical protein KVP18_002394 [Porospora cf. gigantea A]
MTKKRKQASTLNNLNFFKDAIDKTSRSLPRPPFNIIDDNMESMLMHPCNAAHRRSDELPVTRSGTMEDMRHDMRKVQRTLDHLDVPRGPLNEFPRRSAWWGSVRSRVGYLGDIPGVGTLRLFMESLLFWGGVLDVVGVADCVVRLGGPINFLVLFLPIQMFVVMPLVQLAFGVGSLAVRVLHQRLMDRPEHEKTSSDDFDNAEPEHLMYWSDATHYKWSSWSHPESHCPARLGLTRCLDMTLGHRLRSLSILMTVLAFFLAGSDVLRAVDMFTVGIRGAKGPQKPLPLNVFAGLDMDAAAVFQAVEDLNVERIAIALLKTAEPIQTMSLQADSAFGLSEATAMPGKPSVVWMRAVIDIDVLCGQRQQTSCVYQSDMPVCAWNWPEASCTRHHLNWEQNAYGVRTLQWAGLLRPSERLDFYRQISANAFPGKGVSFEGLIFPDADVTPRASEVAFLIGVILLWTFACVVAGTSVLRFMAAWMTWVNLSLLFVILFVSSVLLTGCWLSTHLAVFRDGSITPLTWDELRTFIPTHAIPDFRCPPPGRYALLPLSMPAFADVLSLSLTSSWLITGLHMQRATTARSSMEPFSFGMCLTMATLLFEVPFKVLSTYSWSILGMQQAFNVYASSAPLPQISGFALKLSKPQSFQPLLNNVWNVAAQAGGQFAFDPVLARGYADGLPTANLIIAVQGSWKLARLMDAMLCPFLDLKRKSWSARFYRILLCFSCGVFGFILSVVLHYSPPSVPSLVMWTIGHLVGPTVVLALCSAVNHAQRSVAEAILGRVRLLVTDLTEALFALLVVLVPLFLPAEPSECSITESCVVNDSSWVPEGCWTSSTVSLALVCCHLFLFPAACALLSLIPDNGCLRRWGGEPSVRMRLKTSVLGPTVFFAGQIFKPDDLSGFDSASAYWALCMRYAVPTACLALIQQAVVDLKNNASWETPLSPLSSAIVSVVWLVSIVGITYGAVLPHHFVWMVRPVSSHQLPNEVDDISLLLAKAKQVKRYNRGSQISWRVFDFVNPPKNLLRLTEDSRSGFVSLEID